MANGGQSRLLVPITLEVLVLRDDPAPLNSNPDFSSPATAGTANGPGAVAAAAAAGWEAVNDVSASSTSVTTTVLLPAEADQPTRLRVTSTDPGGGIRQRFGSAEAGPLQAVATVHVYVLRGSVGVAAGPSGQLRVDGHSQTGKAWERLRAMSASGPVNELRVVASSAGGADFWVSQARVQPLDTGNLLSNPNLSQTNVATAQVTGPGADGQSPAADWQLHNAPAAQAGTTTSAELLPSTRNSGRQMLHVNTGGDGCGLLQQFLATATGPPAAQATAWVYLLRGAVGVGVGPSGDYQHGAVTAVAGNWVRLQALSSGTALVNQLVITAHATEGAEFYLDGAEVVQQGHPNLLSNPGFAANPASPNPTTLTGNAIGGPTPANAWTTWTNVPATLTVGLSASDRPGSSGNMLHVNVDGPGCGIVQTFLPQNTGPDRVMASCWVKIVRGSVLIGTGNGGDTSPDRFMTRTGSWQLMQAPNGVSPANEFVVYSASDGGAEYYVDSPQMRWERPRMWAASAMAPPQEPSTDGSGVLQQLLPDPFADRPDDRPAGAYLHWALPDALTRPQPSATSSHPEQFPALPDRWLVARLAPGGPVGQRAVTAWVLDSAAAPVGAPSDAAPEVQPLTSWPNPAANAAPNNPLTALGYGDPAWAAYFDNVENRLAFYDPLSGVGAGPVAYLVCGWWARPNLDPLESLAGITGSKWLTALSTQFGWHLTQRPGSWPTSLLLHGSAVAVSWPGAADLAGSGEANLTEHDSRPDPATIRVSLGDNLNQALGALLATQGEPDADITVLTAYLSLAQSESSGPDGESQLDGVLHAAQFSSSASPPRQSTIRQPAGSTVSPASADPTQVGGGFTPAQRSQPRWFQQAEPAMVIQGAGRSFKHGGDGRFNTDGTLLVRVSGGTLGSLGAAADDINSAGAEVMPASILLGAVTKPGIPEECQALLIELAAIDPGSVQSSPAARARLAVWAPGYQPIPELAALLPAPLAVTLPQRPWTMLRTEWRGSFLASPNGLRDWSLHDVDLEPNVDTPAAAETAQLISGRLHITPGPAAVLAGVAASLHNNPPAGVQPPQLPDPATLAAADIVGGALDGLTAALRGEPQGHLVGASASRPLPTNPVRLRAGRFEITRLRLVDAFGQVVNLLGSSTMRPADATRIMMPPSSSATGSPGALTLRPRHTAQTRVQLRYVAADGTQSPGGGPLEATDSVSPVCGFLLPDFVDGSIEIFDSLGANNGRLWPDASTGSRYESDPGTSATLGDTGSQIANQSLRRIADSLVAVDLRRALAGSSQSSALTALLAVIDTVWYTIDFTRDAGNEHLALLLGHPISVLRAQMRAESGDPTGADSQAIEVRLGALDRLSDGLLGYYLDDDYSRLRLPDPAVARAVGSHPYLDSSPLLLQPGASVAVTMLVQPNCNVHVTTGLQPQKSIGMRRTWTKDGLAKLTPSFRYGPLLLDTRVARLPLPADVHGDWAWLRRPDPHSWVVDPVIGEADTVLSPTLAFSDGWLRLSLVGGLFDPSPEPIDLASISIPPRSGPLNPLRRVGGMDNQGKPWSLSADDAFALAQSGMFKYQVRRDATTVLPVTITQDASGTDLLVADQGFDALVELPECDLTLVSDYPGYLLRAHGSQDLLSVRGGVSGMRDGAALELRPPASDGRPDPSQVWTLGQTLGRAYYPIVAGYPSMSRALLSLATTTGRTPSPVNIWQQQGDLPNPASYWQHWQLVTAGLGDGPVQPSILLYNRQDGTCLTRQVDDAGEASMVASTYERSPNQLWTLSPRVPRDLDAVILDTLRGTGAVGLAIFGTPLKVLNSGRFQWPWAFGAPVGHVTSLVATLVDASGSITRLDNGGSLANANMSPGSTVTVTIPPLEDWPAPVPAPGTYQLSVQMADHIFIHMSPTDIYLPFGDSSDSIEVNIPPFVSVQAIDPPAGWVEANQAPNRVTVDFSDDVDPSTVTQSGTFTVSGAGQGTVTAEPSLPKRRFYFIPSGRGFTAPAPGAPAMVCVVRLSGIRDVRGNPILGYGRVGVAVVQSFQIRPMTGIQSVNPANNQVVRSNLRTIRVQFTQEVNLDTVTEATFVVQSLDEPGQPPMRGVITHDSSNRGVVFTSADYFRPGYGYAIALKGSRIIDAYGSPISGSDAGIVGSDFYSTFTIRNGSGP